MTYCRNMRHLMPICTNPCNFLFFNRNCTEMLSNRIFHIVRINELHCQARFYAAYPGTSTAKHQFYFRIGIKGISSLETATCSANAKGYHTSFSFCHFRKLTNKVVLASTPVNVALKNMQMYSSTVGKDSLKRFIRKMWKRKSYSHALLARSGYTLYTNISENTDILHFFKVLSLEDTFFSWFLVLELQVWLLMVRLQADGEDGIITRNAIIEAMWMDINAKTQQLGVRSTSKKEDSREMNWHFMTSLFSYDEGLMGSDKELAGAVWRRMIRKELQEVDESDPTACGGVGSQNVCEGGYIIADSVTDPRALEVMVCYIRQQIHLLDQIESHTLLSTGTGIIWIKPQLPSEII